MSAVFRVMPEKIVWFLVALSAIVDIIGPQASAVVRARVVSAAHWAYDAVLGWVALFRLVLLLLGGWRGVARRLFVLFRSALRHIVQLGVRLVRFLVGTRMRERAEFDVERGGGGGRYARRESGVGNLSRWETILEEDGGEDMEPEELVRMFQRISKR